MPVRDASLYRSAYMVQPLGVAQFTRQDGAVMTKRVHGLSQCYLCSTLWSRDYASTLNIGRVFVEQWQTGARPAYLCRPPKQCAAAEESLWSNGWQEHAPRTSVAHLNSVQQRPWTARCTLC